jgi:hypothetical protein
MCVVVVVLHAVVEMAGVLPFHYSLQDHLAMEKIQFHQLNV